MSSGITNQSVAQGTNETIDKGKGKAVQLDEETEGDESSDEEMEEDSEEDEFAEIDRKNIITSSRRTRGKQIDFAKAAAEQPATEEDSDDDEDFVEASEEDGDKQDVEMQT